VTAPGLRLGVEGSLRAAGIAGLSTAAAALGDAAALTWTATVDAGAGIVEIAPLVAEAGGLRAEASGAVPFDGRGADLGLTVRLDDVAAFAADADLVRAGSGEMAAHLRGALWGEDGLEASVAGTLAGLELADSGLSALLGGRAGFAAEVAGSIGGSWAVSDLSVEAAGATITGEASVDPAANRLEATVKGGMADLSRLSSLAGLPLKGALTLDGTAQGPLDSPTVTAKARIANGRIGATDWRAIVLDAAFDGPPGDLKGKVTLAADGAIGAVRAGADVARAEDGRIAVRNLTAKGAGLDLGGNLATAPAGLPLIGSLRLKADDLGPVAALGGLDLAGSGTVAVDLSAGRDGGQNAEAKVALRRLGLREGGRTTASVATLEATATMSGPLADPRLKLSATATDTVSGALRLARFGMNAEGGFSRLAVAYRLDGRIEGTQPLPLTVALDGVVARNGGALVADISRFQGKLAERSFSLTAPASFRYADDRIVAGPLALALDKGRLDAAFRLDAAAVALTLEASGIPLDLARIAVPDLKVGGTLTASVSVSGRPERPDGRFRVSADGVTLPDSSLGELPPLTAVVEGGLAAGRLDARASVDGLPATTVAASFAAPVALSVRPPAAGLAPGAPIDARLRLDGDLGALWAVLPIDPHRLAGKAAVDLALAGQPGDLRVSGRADLTGGVYENLETGTLLNDLTVGLTGDGRRLQLVRMTARDDQGGSLEASGFIDVGTGDPLVALRVSLASMRLVHRDDITATASGGIALDGRSADLRLSGDLSFEPIEARLIDGLPPGVVTLDVVEVGGDAPARPAEEAEVAAPVVLALDLDVAMPRRFFVRGRGLDSEWSGKLHIGGTADTPIISGSIAPVRGQFDLAGKVFRLEEGSIHFAGDDDPVPDLDLRLEHQGSTVRATIHITGRATDPKLALSAVPDMPQEEILSRVLFDRGTGNLSAAEALQLANAAATLTGIGGVGGGLLDDIRTRLGIDVLRIGGDDQGANVTAGTYLSDRVFVGATQGTSPESTAATVEIELTPSLSVETDIGQNANSRVGVKWKWDY
jgi:translocation and assembly module TamB